jgi:hypothetical protein
MAFFWEGNEDLHRTTAHLFLGFEMKIVGAIVVLVGFEREKCTMTCVPYQLRVVPK